MTRPKQPHMNIPYTLNLLRNIGYRVTITHVRDFGWSAEIEDRSQLSDINTARWNSYMGRAEFYKAFREDRIFHQQVDGTIVNLPCDEDLKFGDFIHPTGGWTKVRIECPDGQVFEGKRAFGHDEHFVKANGLRGALQRAYGKLRLSEQTLDLEVHAHDEDDLLTEAVNEEMIPSQ